MEYVGTLLGTCVHTTCLDPICNFCTYFSHNQHTHKTIHMMHIFCTHYPTSVHSKYDVHFVQITWFFQDFCFFTYPLNSVYSLNNMWTLPTQGPKPTQSK